MEYCSLNSQGTKEGEQLWKCFCLKTKILTVTKKNCYLSNNMLLVPFYKEIGKICFPGKGLCVTNTLTRRLDALQTSLVRRLLILFFNGHFCFLATRKYCINLYLLLTGTDNSGAIYSSWAVEEKEKGNLKEIYHFFNLYCCFKLYDPCSTFLGLQITKLKSDRVGIL